MIVKIACLFSVLYEQGTSFVSYLFSVFIRNCKNCSTIVACQQFRVRENQNLTAFLACASEPIIESSSLILFAPYQLYYPALEGNLFKEHKLWLCSRSIPVGRARAIQLFLLVNP